MALPITVDTFIQYGKASSFLAATDFSKQKMLRGSVLPNRLPLLLSTVTDLVEWNDNRDGDDETLVDTANYMYQLCGQYIPKAKQLIANMGQGLIVNPATGAVSILAPFYIEFYVGVTASPIIVNGESVNLPSPGDTTMTLPLPYIKQSLEIELDGISVPRVATDRIAANVNYTNNDATITVGPVPNTFQQGQLWVIQGDQYQTV